MGGYDPDIFMDIITIHLLGKLRLANAFRQHLKATQAGTAVFLASPAATLITGVTDPVEEGYTASWVSATAT
jgi:NAD(P)-dependent dehydrogenase (short-subunit alcohol dehydrogenase family)